ncbi:hypothetical protein PspLS_04313 [Pyricularia sp. CBS 133598]|nr:hypothetical protein PspLS_04313 [Pyricularia sp. CBS 133598]
MPFINTPTTPPRAWKRLLLPLLAAFVPAIIGAGAGWLTQQSFSQEGTVQWITIQRVNIQVAAQVAAAALGGLQVYAVSTLVNNWTNTRIAATASHAEDPSSTGPRAGITVDKLKFRSAVVRSTVDFDLSWHSIGQLLAWWLLLKALAPLWAGTITPKIVTAIRNGTIEIPAYSHSTSGRWAMNCAPGQNCGSDFSFERGSSTLKEGTFTFHPWKMRPGALYSIMERASWWDADSIPKYQKQDNTGFTYQGRSYGVATSPGLSAPKLRDDSGKITSFNYTENGYLARVTCQYNRSSAIGFGRVESVRPATMPSQISIGVGWAGGELPNGGWEGCQVWSNEGLDWSLVMAGVRSNDGRRMYGIVAGRSYADLNQTQCSVTFTPTAFRVAVSMVARTIRVSPLPETPEGPGFLDIDPTHALVNNSFHAVSYISQTLSTSYTSVIGDILRFNTLNVARRRAQSVGGGDQYLKIPASEQDVLTSLQEAIEVVLDNSLGTIGAAQMMLARDKRPSAEDTTSLAVEAVRFGEPGFVYPSVALAVLLFAVVLYEVVRLSVAKWPRGAAPGVDCLDLKSAILGTAKGSLLDGDGTVLPTAAAAAAVVLEGWDGKADDAEAGALLVTMDDEIGALRLTRGENHGQRVVERGEDSDTNSNGSAFASLRRQKGRPWSSTSGPLLAGERLQDV